MSRVIDKMFEIMGDSTLCELIEFANGTLCDDGHLMYDAIMYAADAFDEEENEAGFDPDPVSIVIGEFIKVLLDKYWDEQIRKELK